MGAGGGAARTGTAGHGTYDCGGLVQIDPTASRRRARFQRRAVASRVLDRLFMGGVRVDETLGGVGSSCQPSGSTHNTWRRSARRALGRNLAKPAMRERGVTLVPAHGSPGRASCRSPLFVLCSCWSNHLGRAPTDRPPCVGGASIGWPWPFTDEGEVSSLPRANDRMISFKERARACVFTARASRGTRCLTDRVHSLVIFDPPPNTPWRR